LLEYTCCYNEGPEVEIEDDCGFEHLVSEVSFQGGEEDDEEKHRFVRLGRLLFLILILLIFIGALIALYLWCLRRCCRRRKLIIDVYSETSPDEEMVIIDAEVIPHNPTKEQAQNALQANQFEEYQKIHAQQCHEMQQMHQMQFEMMKQMSTNTVSERLQRCNLSTVGEKDVRNYDGSEMPHIITAADRNALVSQVEEMEGVALGNRHGKDVEREDAWLARRATKEGKRRVKEGFDCEDPDALLVRERLLKEEAQRLQEGISSSDDSKKESSANSKGKSSDKEEFIGFGGEQGYQVQDYEVHEYDTTEYSG